MNTLCTSSTCIARKACATYRAEPTSKQQYANYDTGLGLRCEHRQDINFYPSDALVHWRDVDKQKVN